MPSRVTQRIKIIGIKNKNTGEERTLMIAEKTGFLDVWINGVHYYYNSMQEGDLSNVDVEQLVQDAASQQPRKRIVVVRRKQ